MTAATIASEKSAEVQGLPGAPPEGLNDEILRWTYYMQQVFRMLPGGVPTPNSRAAAMTYAAIYDAVNSITPLGQPYLGTVPVGAGCAPDRRGCLAAAVNDAAAFVLAGSLPRADVGRYVLSAYLAEEERIGRGPGASAGSTVGRLAALRMLRVRQDDGTGEGPPYVPGQMPGAWRPTGSGCEQAVTPNFGEVRPFTMASPWQFRPQRPGEFGTYAELLESELYAEQYTKVKTVGRFDAEQRGNRTSEQSLIAVFWSNDVDGTYHPPGQLLDHTRIISQQYGLTLGQNARLFGLVGLALGDGAISSFDSKYETEIDLWRPETAIHLAETDGNQATTEDPGWEPLLLNAAETLRINPCFPAYTSGHATFAGAWERVIQGYFGLDPDDPSDTISYIGTTDDPQARGVTREFPSISAAAAEMANSRVYLGVHFPFDGTFGLSAGEELGEYIYATQLQPA